MHLFHNKASFYSEELLALCQTPRWRMTPCWLSTTAYSIHLQLPSILEAFRPSATWGSAMPWWYGPTYDSINGTISEKSSFNMKWVLLFSLQLSSETFLILRRIQLDIIINVHTVYFPYLKICMVRKWGRTKKKAWTGCEGSACCMAQYVSEKCHSKIHRVVENVQISLAYNLSLVNWVVLHLFSASLYIYIQYFCL